MIGQESAGSRKAVLFELPDSTPEDAARELKSAVRQAMLGPVDLSNCRDLPGMATLIASLCRRGVIVVIDEFQVCHRGPLRGFPSLLKQRVDRLQASTGGLVVMGSVQSEMESMLQDRRASLFGRPTFNINLGPWGLETIFEVCADQRIPGASRWLTLWTLFGGVPSYWRLYSMDPDLNRRARWREWARNLLATLFLRPGGPLRDEGEMLLGREIRGVHLSLLRTIAERRVPAYGELAASLPSVASIGPYLTTLVRDLQLVAREVPIFASHKSRNARYVIADQFLRSWLAAIGPSIRESRVISQDQALDRLLERLSTLEGIAFERMVRHASEEASRKGLSGFPLGDLVRGYWSGARRAGKSPEIDFVAWSEDYRRVRFGSCKRSASKHTTASLAGFREHVRSFLSSKNGRRFRTSQQEFALFSPDFEGERRRILEGQGWICRHLRDFREMLCRDRNGSAGDLEACAALLEQ